MLSLRSRWTGCFRLKVQFLPSQASFPLLCCADLIFPLAAEALKALQVTHASCVTSESVEARLKEQAEAHQAALQVERDVAARAKQVTARVTKEKNDAESALKEKATTLADTEKHLQLAETRLGELKVKPAEWQRELREINQQLNGKCSA